MAGGSAVLGPVGRPAAGRGGGTGGPAAAARPSRGRPAAAAAVGRPRLLVVAGWVEGGGEAAAAGVRGF